MVAAIVVVAAAAAARQRRYSLRLSGAGRQGHGASTTQCRDRASTREDGSTNEPQRLVVMAVGGGGAH